jgi:hypothetical protein
VVPYISFNAIVGRNSTFHLLTKEQMEELGGVEYRALNALLWLVAGVSLIVLGVSGLYHHLFLQYFFGLQLISFTVIGPYISTPRWSENFQPPNLVRAVSKGWYVTLLPNTEVHERRSAGLLFSRLFPRLRIRVCLW